MKFIIDVPDMFIGVAADNMAKELRSIVYDAGYGESTVTVVDETISTNEANFL